HRSHLFATTTSRAKYSSTPPDASPRYPLWLFPAVANAKLSAEIKGSFVIMERHRRSLMSSRCSEALTSDRVSRGRRLTTFN
ncbi:hypothetical protein KUCAC02_016919, partial [Chaenocephalus aceratus]